MSTRRPSRRQPPPEPAPRRGPPRKNHVPTIVAGAVTLVLLIVAIVLVKRSGLTDDREAEREEARREAKAEKAARAKLRALANRVDPFEENLGKLVEAFRRHDPDELVGFVDKRGTFEYLVAKAAGKKETPEKKWSDLSIAEQLNYFATLLKEPPLDGRWKIAKVGDWRTEACAEPGYSDHTVVVIPRVFPSGEEDEVRLVVRRQTGDRPLVRGATIRVTKTPTTEVAAVKDDLVVPDAVKKKAGFKSLDNRLGGAEIPVAKGRGDVDERGVAMGLVAKVDPVPGTKATLSATIETHINTLLDPEATKAARAAVDELVLIGKPSIPPLLNRLVGRDLKNADDVFACHQAIQGLRAITGQRFGFEPQVGSQILTAAAESEQQNALRRWFGWWQMNAKTFVPSLTEQQKKELKRRQRRAARNRNS